MGKLGRSGLWRSRWAAMGAAVAVTLGGGGLFVANAASSPVSSVVTITPARILDTRTDVGLPGPFVSAVSQKLQVTGAIVPAGSTGVLLNVTVVNPTANGFLAIRPGDATGAPSTSSLNFDAGDIVPNAVQVGLPTTGANVGQIDITFDAYGAVGPTTEVLIDVVGYTVAGGAASSAGPAGGAGIGPTGPEGDTGAAGPFGPSGPKGDTGTKGDTGNTGATGPKGDSGATGSAGPVGSAGAIGPAGPGGLQVVDANGEVVGPLAAEPYNSVGSPALVGFGSDFAWIGIDGKVVSLGEFAGLLFFESVDCSGPPAASSNRTRMQDWYGYAMPWPASGPDRKGYRVTATDLSWIGVSTRYGSWYQTIGAGSPALGCVPGAPGVGGAFPMRTSAFQVVEVSGALILDDFSGPLSIKTGP